MKLARLGELGSEIPALSVQDVWHDLRSITPDIDGPFLASGGLSRVRSALEAGELEPVELPPTIRIGAPISRPGAVICIGMNYAAHAAESGAAPPAEPVIFLKTASSVTGPYDAVTIPPRSKATDWEVELGVVIGRRATYLKSTAEAADCIAGFVTANDLSERDFQMQHSGGQWSKGKCFPGFCPLGPWLVTPDEVDHHDLRLRSYVNGEVRQDSSTADQIFSVEHIIHDLSQYLVLESGDVILTGTPEGVAMSGRFPYLKSGDVVEIEVEGLGRQSQHMVDAGDAAE